MTLSTIPNTKEFQFGLLKYRITSTLLTVMLGMCLLMTDQSGNAQDWLHLQASLWMAAATGMLGAVITSYQFTQYIKDAIRSCVVDNKEIVKNNYRIWREQCSEWSFTPIIGVIASLAMLLASEARHGTIWVLVYVSLSPVFAAIFRAAILALMGTPAHRTVI